MFQEKKNKRERERVKAYGMIEAFDHLLNHLCKWNLHDVDIFVMRRLHPLKDPHNYFRKYRDKINKNEQFKVFYFILLSFLRMSPHAHDNDYPT